MCSTCFGHWVWVVSVLQAEACNTDTTQTQPRQISNTQRAKSKRTDVVIQQHSHKLLMMDILMSETCWAHKKWNKIASDIKLVFYSSTVTITHGPIHTIHLYKLLISLLSCQSILPLFRICMNFVQFTQSNALCQSMEQAHNSSSISKVHSDIIHSIPTAALVPFSSYEYKMVFWKYILNLPFKPSSKYPLYYLRYRCNEADSVMLAAFCSLWRLQSNHCNF